MSESNVNKMIYSTIQVGRLLRRLNLMCIQTAGLDIVLSRTAAHYSTAVEEAIRFAGMEEESEAPHVR